MPRKFSIFTEFKGVDKFSTPVNKMVNSVQKLRRKVSIATRGMRRGFGKVVKKIKQATLSILKWGSVAVAGAITGIIIAINKAADAADSLAKRSRRLKFPIQALQEWRFVAEQSGLTTGEFDKSLEKFTKTVGEARAGTGTLVTILKKSNPELLKQLTTTENTEEAFNLYLKAIRGTKNQLDKTALATAAFGRTGAKFLNITEQSTKAIKALRKEQKENGNITKEQAKAAEDYNDAINSLKKSFTGLLQNVFLPVLPVMTDLIRKFRQFIVRNRELISVNLQRYLRVAVEMLGRFATRIAKVLQNKNNLSGVTTMVKILVGTVKLLGSAFQGLGTFIGETTAKIILWGDKVGSFLGGGLFKIVKKVKTTFTDFKSFLIDTFNSILAATKKFFKDLAVTIADLNPLKDIGADLGSLIFEMTKSNTNSVPSQSGGQTVSSQGAAIKNIQENNSRAEVTIKDESGRAEITGGKLGAGITLQTSGAF